VLEPEGWDAERVERGLALKTETRVPLQNPIPVVIHYTTAVARADGTISFYEDIYRHDAALERALAAGYPGLR
jgi:murein L,D-transpeptidase YcbB/YkuD